MLGSMESTARPVVVGYDGSPDAERAVGWGIDEARATGLPLLVVVVAHDGAVRASRVPGWDDDVVHELHQRARDLVGDVGVGATVEVRPGSAAHTLVEASHEASVLVLGSRGHGAVAGLVIGSVSQQVARHAHCPVVVVREPRRPDARRVVVGVDDSAGSRKALELACAHAASVRAPVTVLHGSRHPAFASGTDSGVRPLAVGERAIADHVAAVAVAHPEVAVELEPVPVAAARALIDASADAALVVVGSRGRGTVEEVLLGSVAQEVLHGAHCPVAVVH